LTSFIRTSTNDDMKIGIVTPSIYMDTAHHGGRIFAPGDLARHLVAGLTARGHQVTWFSAPEDPRGSTLVAGDQSLLTKNLAMRVFQDVPPDLHDQFSLYGTKTYYELDLVAQAYQAAKEGNVDLIHNFHSFGHFAHFFQELTGVPTLYTLHDPVPTRGMLERWLFDRFPAHRYISLSDAQRGDVADHFIATVYNGLDTALFPFSAAPGSGLISVGRMVPEKGHDIAIAAAKAAGKPLVFATWMNDTVKSSPYFKEKIEPHVDGKDVVINSLLQGESLSSAYQKAEALLFPLQWEEPFGLVMIEAMSCGTPVIAFNRGSVSEIVKDGVTGFVVDPAKGVDGLVEAIKKIGTIDRAACRALVEEKFTVDKMVEGYEKVYEKILSQQPA